MFTSIALGALTVGAKVAIAAATAGAVGVGAGIIGKEMHDDHQKINSSSNSSDKKEEKKQEAAGDVAPVKAEAATTNVAPATPVVSEELIQQITKAVMNALAETASPKED